jgi:hypothetical protein
LDESLRRILQLLQDLNSRVKTPIISESEFTEEYENLDEFSELPRQIEVLVGKLKCVNSDDIDTIVENLIHLHLKLSDCIWHLDQIHELVKRVAGNIRDVAN